MNLVTSRKINARLACPIITCFLFTAAAIVVAFVGDLLCGELHEMTGTKHRVEDEEDAVPQTGTAVHSDEVEVKVLRDAVDDC